MDKRAQNNPKVSSDEWYTPKWIIDRLGPFDLDPCAAPIDVRPHKTASVMLTKEDDGLSKIWHGVVWMNPPYNRQLLRAFCEKMAEHDNGIALLMNRNDNIMWQEVIFPTAKSMIFMRQRVKFIRPEGGSGSPFFGSCLVAWGDECDKRLKYSGIEGKYVKLNDINERMTLRGRLKRYCELHGQRYEETGKTIKAEMPSGAILTIYANYLICGYGYGYRLYGVIERPWSKYNNIFYISEKGAKSLYNVLCENIKAFDDEARRAEADTQGDAHFILRRYEE